MYKLIIVFVSFLYFSGDLSADSKPLKLLLGVDAGYYTSKINMNAFEVSAGIKYGEKAGSFEAGLAYTAFKSLSDFDGVADLNLFSRVAYIKANYFINDFLYAGGLLGVSLNKVDEASRDRYRENSIRSSPNYSTGKYFGGQVGVYYPLLSFLSLQLQSRVGLHNYKMASGSLYLSGYSNPTIDTYTEELKLDFYAYFSLGINFYFNIQEKE
jgi:hypothetical protein